MNNLVPRPAIYGVVTNNGAIAGTITPHGTMGATVQPGGSGGTRDYERLNNKPCIEDVELTGNRTLADFGMGAADAYDIHQLFR